MRQLEGMVKVVQSQRVRRPTLRTLSNASASLDPTVAAVAKAVLELPPDSMAEVLSNSISVASASTSTTAAASSTSDAAAPGGVGGVGSNGKIMSPASPSQLISMAEAVSTPDAGRSGMSSPERMVCVCRSACVCACLLNLP